MQVRNKTTGAVETLRHGPATDAVTAGTHEFVNIDADGDERKTDKATLSKPAKAEK